VSAAATPTQGTAPLVVQFSSTATDADGTIVSYAWDFGDGSSSTAANPSHTYTTAGTYTARFTATDDRGATLSASVVITAAEQQIAGKQIYVATDGSPYGDGSVEQPISLAHVLDPRQSPVKPGDTVIFLSGIYRVSTEIIFRPAGTGISTRTVFKAAPNARVIFTTVDGLPPKVRISPYTRFESLWFGGQQTPTADNCFCTGGGGNRGVEFVNNTFFGYREGSSQGGGEYFLYQGNRYIRSGRQALQHSIYLTGGYTAGKMGQHTIVDNNIFIANGGYAVRGGHNMRNAIVTRNFIANTAHGISMEGSQHLIANNFIWKMKGYPTDPPNRRIGAYLNGQNIRFINNILGGPDAIIYYSHGSNTLENNAFLNVTPKGVAPVTLTHGLELAQLGVSEQEIDTTVAALEQAFIEPVDYIYANANIEPLFAKLKLVVPSSSPIYETGKPWFSSNFMTNIGPQAPAPSTEDDFWAAFRALGLRDFDKYGNVIGGDSVPPTATITNLVNGTILTGTRSLSATAIDNVEVVKVLFKVDGVAIGTASTLAPFTASLNTTTLANGVHTITVESTDVSGNIKISTPVSITVRN